MNKQIQQELLNCLKDLKSKVETRTLDPVLLRMGICWYVDCKLRLGRSRYLEKHFSSWPKFSGDETLPIPHPSRFPLGAYHKIENKWYPEVQHNSEDIEYVNNRMDLLNHCIERLTQEVNNNNRYFPEFI